MEIKKLEDSVSSFGLNDMTVALAVGSYLGGQSILENKRFAGLAQEIKKDGTTVGKLDNISGKKIAEYINSKNISDKVRFNSEEKMPFKIPVSWEFAGIFDDLDGSINPMIGGTNLHYVGVGGVIHEKSLDEQIATAAYLPFSNSNEIFVAEKGKGTYKINISENKILKEKIEFSSNSAQKNSLIESGWSSPNTILAEEALLKEGFYNEMGIGAKDRVTGGIFQTVSGIRDSRQIVLNFAASHQADYCYLLLQEAGAEVIGQNGKPMYSTSNAMLAIAPSFKGDKNALKEKYIKAMASLNENGYLGWNPEAPLKKVCE